MAEYASCGPASYASNNGDQRWLNLKALDLAERDFEPRNNKDVQFLDIGCGTGDFTFDCLLPRCPSRARIVAVDSSEEMLSYARQKFAHPRIAYGHLDIGRNVDEFLAKYGTFDRIYSFFCLNWVRDQRQAIRNVAELLSSSGDCLLVFPAYSRAKTPWMQLAQLDRWRKHKNFHMAIDPDLSTLSPDEKRRLQKDITWALTITDTEEDYVYVVHAKKRPL
ncbi:hypothetical protein HPB50_024836 [Hyalomma asiaticum]|uniref:Uncharacterized protein n=1 Tax=Hyalomma asiaticum TaxID=266040 RepID=A0ACB7TBE5_HYAAI|nr:hypothetical protein HPB50_024836 [Hyalomma asiaticum]